MIYRKIFFHHSKRITHQYSFMTYINKPTKNTYQEYLPRIPTKNTYQEREGVMSLAALWAAGTAVAPTGQLSGEP